MRRVKTNVQEVVNDMHWTLKDNEKISVSPDEDKVCWSRSVGGKVLRFAFGYEGPITEDFAEFVSTRLDKLEEKERNALNQPELDRLTVIGGGND